MPNVFTRVPDRNAPELPPNLLSVRLADLFMKVMVSTPKSGTLANTWVTPATFWMCVVCAPGLLLLTWLAIVAGHWWSIALAPLCLLLSIGSAAVVLVAAMQKSSR